MERGLVALAIGTFALGITEYGMMGILNNVSADIGITVVEAGSLISLYSLGVAVGAPLLLLLRNKPLKRVMLLLSLMIFAGNLSAALSPGYTSLLFSRFLSGLPHGAYFGAGAIVCSRLAKPGHGAAAVSVMVGGMTVANLVGVPAATQLSLMLSWRAVFMTVAFAGMLAFITVRMWVPALRPSPSSGIGSQFSFLRKPAPWLIYAGVFFGQAGVYCWLSYIDPIMTDVTHFSPSAMTWVMMVAGSGMVAGNALAGKMADRFGISETTGIIAASMIVVMPLLYLMAPYRIPSLILAFLATAGLFGIGGPLQFLIVKYARGGEMLGGAGIQIAFNVSNAMSAAVGAAVIHLGYGLASPALAGVPFAVIGASALFILHRRYDRHP